MRKFILVLSLCLFVSMGVHVEKALSEIDGCTVASMAAESIMQARQRGVSILLPIKKLVELG